MMRPFPRAWMCTAVCSASTLAILFCLPSGRATAANQPAVTGIDSIHAKVQVGGKLCFADHEHYGEANMPSERGAQAAAIRDWQVFTTFEYGTVWGSYAKATGKRMICKTAGGRWTCAVHARPCRTGR